MKVGTDGVLLGAWTDASQAKNILDIGCGSGLLSLMLAQKSEANITAIDIEKDAVIQSKFNTEQSKWKHRINVIHGDFREFFPNQSAEEFDLIICNPPFFNSKLTNSPREIARHAENLPFETLLQGVKYLLSTNGSFYLIIPMLEEENFLIQAEKVQLYPEKILYIKGNPQKAAKRLLIKLKKKICKVKKEEMIIEYQRHEYSKEYKNLVKDYLLD